MGGEATKKKKIRKNSKIQFFKALYAQGIFILHKSAKYFGNNAKYANKSKIRMLADFLPR